MPYFPNPLIFLGITKKRHHIVLEIIQHLHSEGYPVKDFIPDGKIKRFEIEKNDRKSGYYIAHRNYLIRTGEEYFYVQYGSWKTGETKSFSTLKGIMEPADRKNLQQQVQKDKKIFETERKKEYEIAAKDAKEKWETLSTTGTSDYLIRKQIQDCPKLEVRYDNFNGDIYIPIKDHQGKIWSIQKIPRDGKFKPFHPGTRVTGHYFVFGDPSDHGRIFIAEGLATTASIRLATNETSVCAFMSGNLSNVSLQFRKLYPNARIIICGDEDSMGERPDGTQVNPGRLSAEKAANQCGGIAIFPRFPDGITGSDFNDLHVQVGIEEVFNQINDIEDKSIIPVGLNLSYDELHSPFPDENEKFVRLDTHTNIAELLRRLHVTIRYNVISKQEEILIPGLSFSIDNMANASYGHILTACKKAKIPTENLQSHLTIISDWNPYNPVRTWIESIPWDGQNRLPEFYDTIKSRNEPLKETLIRKWLISAIAAAFEPNGVSAHGVLVLQGSQSLGKTAWFKKLVPQELGVIADGMFLKPDDRDSVFQAISKWIVELGELDATFRRSDIAQLKAFLTKDKDLIRRPYAKLESNYARRTIFFGSVNEMDFLKDPTGNRRFWTIECESIHYGHSIDMQQLWAEVRELYLKGEKWILDPETLQKLNEHNEQFQETDPIEERIEMTFDWDNGFGARWINATQVCLELGIDNPTKRDTGMAAAFLRKKCKQEKHRKRFLVPVKIIF